MRRPAARGYTLVALTIGITVMMVMIAAVLPLASTQLQRERETELIFRGKQYAEGIRCFRRKYGRYPTTLKEMFQTRPRTLRKFWKDPITNSNDWGLVTLGTLNPIGPQKGTGLSTDGGSGFGGGFGGTGKGGGPPATPTPNPFGGAQDGSGSGTGSGSTSGGSKFGGGPASGDQTPMLPVMGVYSKSKKKSIRTFLGRDVYAEWKFTEATLMQSGNETSMGPSPGMGPGGGGPPPPGSGGPTK